MYINNMRTSNFVNFKVSNPVCGNEICRIKKFKKCQVINFSIDECDNYISDIYPINWINKKIFKEFINDFHIKFCNSATVFKNYEKSSISRISSIFSNKQFDFSSAGFILGFFDQRYRSRGCAFERSFKVKDKYMYKFFSAYSNTGFINYISDFMFFLFNIEKEDFSCLGSFGINFKSIKFVFNDIFNLFGYEQFDFFQKDYFNLPYNYILDIGFSRLNNVFIINNIQEFFYLLMFIRYKIRRDFRNRFKYQSSECKSTYNRFIVKSFQIDSEFRIKARYILAKMFFKGRLTRSFINNYCLRTARGKIAHKYFRVSRMELKRLLDSGSIRGYKRGSWLFVLLL